MHPLLSQAPATIPMSAPSNDAKPVDAGAPLFGEFSVDEYRPMKVIVIGAGAGGILAGVRSVFTPAI